MRFLVLSAITFVATSAAAEVVVPPPSAPVIKNTFGFDYMSPKRSKCTKVSGALLTKLTKSYTCAAPEEGATASGKTAVAHCAVKSAKTPSSFLLFTTVADCKVERQTQIDNAAGA